MINQLSEGFMLGLATGTTCLATCGPVYAPYLMQYERNLWKSIIALCEISAGRFITYAIVGLIAGLLGDGLKGLNKDLFTASAYILFSIFLIVTTFRTSKKEKCCQTGKWSAFVDRPVILGILTGINFCPSFLLAFTKAVDLSGPMAGLALFSSFFVGTSLFLIPLSFFGIFGMKKQFRLIARTAAILISVWFISQAGVSLYNYFHEKKVASEIDPSLIVNVIDSPAVVYIASSDSSTLSFLQAGLTSARKKSALFVDKPADIPDSGIVFVGQESITGLHLENLSFRKKGRLIMILPDSSYKGINSSQVKKLIDYLAFYSFKIDPDSGTVYQIPRNILE